ncbi:sulfatase-like hydrolase/transferase [bacterium]|nr:sulfatase-like hydrolase/transferase [bacterium]
MRCRTSVTCLLFLTVALLTVTCRAASAADAKPNLIYILLDDAGYGDLSCYGQKHFKTPNIDRLAAEGLRFTDHYSGSTVCAPTRCTLITGLHTGHCVVRGNREVKPEGQAPMPADTVTLPRLLAKAGYATGMFGKWGLGAPGSTSDPMEHFSRFYGYNCQREAHTYYPDHLWSDRTKVELDGKTYSHDLIVNAAFEFIRDSHLSQQPFFCYLPVTIPHAAMHVPEEDAAQFRKQFTQFEDKTGKYRGPLVKNPAAAFAGMMTRLDRNVGQLLELLVELDIDDNTLVMLSSDNGPHQEGGHMPDFFDSNGPFRGHKRDLYEGGIRAPLIARWPGRIAAGRTTDLISAHWDTLPTFCELAGADAPRKTDGLSLVPTLLGRGEQQQHEVLYWEFTERGSSQAVRMGRWKGVRTNLKKNPDAPLELYDLETDIGETTNIAGTNPDVMRKLNAALKAEHVESATFPLFGAMSSNP